MIFVSSNILLTSVEIDDIFEETNKKYERREKRDGRKWKVSTEENQFFNSF